LESFSFLPLNNPDCFGRFNYLNLIKNLKVNEVETVGVNMEIREIIVLKVWSRNLGRSFEEESLVGEAQKSLVSDFISL
jgi:hypothetical protein